MGVYTGTGATMAIDVETVLSDLQIPFLAIDETDVKDKDGLQRCNSLVMPGGYTEQCLRHLGTQGLRNIREFVANGGGYIGICLGAYAAPKIGIVETTMKRGRGIRVERVHVVKPKHPLFKGDQRSHYDFFYQNGPLMTPAENDESLATYIGGATAILSTRYGYGRAILFSPHPEKRPDTVHVLKNAVRFCAQINFRKVNNSKYPQA